MYILSRTANLVVWDVPPLLLMAIGWTATPWVCFPRATSVGSQLIVSIDDGFDVGIRGDSSATNAQAWSQQGQKSNVKRFKRILHWISWDFSYINRPPLDRSRELIPSEEFLDPTHESAKYRKPTAQEKASKLNPSCAYCIWYCGCSKEMRNKLFSHSFSLWSNFKIKCNAVLLHSRLFTSWSCDTPIENDL